MSKITLTMWKKVLSQAFIHSHNQPVRPVVPYAKLGTPTEITQYHKGIEIMVNSHCPDSHCASISYAPRTPSPILPGKSTMCRNLPRDIHQNRRVTLWPWLKEDCLASRGIPWSCCKAVLLKWTTPAIEHALVEEGRSGSSGLNL